MGMGERARDYETNAAVPSNLTSRMTEMTSRKQTDIFFTDAIRFFSSKFIAICVEIIVIIIIILSLLEFVSWHYVIGLSPLNSTLYFARGLRRIVLLGTSRLSCVLDDSRSGNRKCSDLGRSWQISWNIIKPLNLIVRQSWTQ